jgi:hypothetical protein
VLAQGALIPGPSVPAMIDRPDVAVRCRATCPVRISPSRRTPLPPLGAVPSCSPGVRSRRAWSVQGCGWACRARSTSAGREAPEPRTLSRDRNGCRILVGLPESQFIAMIAGPELRRGALEGHFRSA